jgi:hypothetical protein
MGMPFLVVGPIFLDPNALQPATQAVPALWAEMTAPGLQFWQSAAECPGAQGDALKVVELGRLIN